MPSSGLTPFHQGFFISRMSDSITRKKPLSPASFFVPVCWMLGHEYLERSLAAMSRGPSSTAAVEAADGDDTEEVDENPDDSILGPLEL